MPRSCAVGPDRTLRPVSRTVAESTRLKARLAFCSTDRGVDRLGRGGRQPQGGFVEHEQAGLGHDGARQGEHLLLTTREGRAVGGDPVLEVGKQVEKEVEVLRDALAVLAQIGADHEVLHHGQVAEGAAPLRDVGDAQGRHLLRAFAADVLAVEHDRPFGGDGAADRPQRGGLACAVGAEDSDGAPVGHRERDPFEHFDGPV